MTLRDHFQPPLSQRKSWEGFHGGWPMVIVQQLGKILPEPFEAEPRVHLGMRGEVDVATFDQSGIFSDLRSGDESDSSIATSLWSAPDPTLTIDTDFADVDEYEVRIYDSRKDRQLVAAIEIISPTNKDRLEHRQLFASKCVSLLRQGVCMVLVDIVTARTANLYQELLSLAGESDPALGSRPPATYAATTLWRGAGEIGRLQTWYYPLTLGGALPCLPLWLSERIVIPLDLNASYEQTCSDLKNPP